MGKKKKKGKKKNWWPKPVKRQVTVPNLDTDSMVIEGIKPNKVIHQLTRELIASAMRREAMEGWYESNENPRKPDSQIAVEILRQLATVSETLAQREGKPATVEAVVVLAAQTVAWVQGLTYQKNIKAWA